MASRMNDCRAASRSMSMPGGKSSSECPAGSAYAALAGHSEEDLPPGMDMDREAALQSFIREAIGRNLVASAQDVSGGGLAVAIAECCMWSGLGAKLRLGVSGSPAIELFGESPSRLVLSSRPRHAAAIELLARQFGLHSEILGTVGGVARSGR